MKIAITPRSLSGSVQAISSKSHAHRLLIASALSENPPEVSIATTSQDIEATKDCLSQLGEKIPVLNCCESGSTLRFLIPVVMALKDEAIFLGCGRLPERPLSPLKEEMENHGCTFFKGDITNEPAFNGNITNEPAKEICRIKGKLKGGTFTLPGNISSQYITGLLFALPLLEEDSRIRMTSPPESVKYIELTLDVLKQFNIHIAVEEENNCPVYTIKGGQKYTAKGTVFPDGDWSNTAFWVVAGILSKGSGILCRGVNPGSIQGDKEVAALAEKMGGIIKRAENRLDASAGTLNAIDIDASHIPDLVPIMAVAAATAKGTTRIHNAGRLRIKESDRLAAMYDCLSRVGADITEEPKGLIIKGVPKLKGGAVDGYNDHRIVMAMAIASIVCENPVIIEGAQAVNKSYPGFFDDFKSLGGEYHVL